MNMLCDKLKKETRLSRRQMLLHWVKIKIPRVQYVWYLCLSEEHILCACREISAIHCA